MLRDFEQILDRFEPRFAGQFARDVRFADLLDRLDEDLALVHWIPAAGLDVGVLPDADAAADPSAADALSEAFCEDHPAGLRAQASGPRAGPGMRVKESGLCGRGFQDLGN